MRIDFGDGLSVDIFLHEQGDRWISDVLRRREPFDPHVVAIMKAFLRPAQTLLDIGANIGIFSLLGSKLVGPEGQVMAIEPSPGNLDLLRRSVAADEQFRNVVVRACAGGREETTLRLSLSEDNQGDHRLDEIDPGERNTVDVRVRKIDDLTKLKHRPVHFAKIDTQGSETSILAGMSSTLHQSPNIRLLTEFWPYGLVRCGSSANELMSILGDRFDRFWLLLGVEQPQQIDAVSLAEMASVGPLSPETQAHADLLCLNSEDKVGCEIADELFADWSQTMHRITSASGSNIT